MGSAIGAENHICWDLCRPQGYPHNHAGFNGLIIQQEEYLPGHGAANGPAPAGSIKVATVWLAEAWPSTPVTRKLPVTVTAGSETVAMSRTVLAVAVPWLIDTEIP